jgi:hypothetical protein
MEKTLPFLEYKKYRGNHAEETGCIVPLEFFLEVDDRKDAENDKRDDFLDCLQLSRGELIRPDTVCRYLEAILE